MPDSNPAHRWKFARIGSVDQVVFRDGVDIAAIEGLDRKLWMALCMPTTHVEVDARTLTRLDTDADGSIRPPEILAAVRWAAGVFHDLGSLMDATDAVSLANIRDTVLRESVQSLLHAIGKPEATVISLSDVDVRTRMLNQAAFNGDGIVPAAIASDEATRRDIADIVSVLGGVIDRGGQPGLDATMLETFFSQATAWQAWSARIETESALVPFGREATAAAADAVDALEAKVEDFFTRCRLVQFDARAQPFLNGLESDYPGLAATVLSPQSDAIAALPLAPVRPGADLPRGGTVNPAWTERLAHFFTHAVEPVCGDATGALTEADWLRIRLLLAPYRAWRRARPETPLCGMDPARLRELIDGDARARIDDLIRRDAVEVPELTRAAELEKMILFHRDLYEVLTNTVNFADFYSQNWAVFQCGTLYLDARACHLCIEAPDPVRHAALAGHAGAFLAYCDLARIGEPRRSIVAVVSDGASDNLMVGRNGVFFDRKGRDWNATVTKIVSNPISVREAFWLPYKKLIRMIEDQIAKRAQAADAESSGKMARAAETIATADQQPPPLMSAPPVGSKKIELGTIALIGTALAGLSALISGFLHAIFGLGLWMPVGLLGLLLLISGPSMLLAALKLRQRNLGPILDANGWAVNTRARMTIPFGAALTEVARLPPGAARSFDDPFARQRRPWKLLLVLAALAGFYFLRTCR